MVLANWLSLKATDFSDILLHQRPWKYNFSDYKLMAENSLGKQLFNTMNSHQINYKPKLIKHDFKYILLGYKMEMEGEIELHSFLLGNKDYNVMGIIYLFTCLLILPETFNKAKIAHKRGRKSVCLKKINLEHLVEKDITSTRQVLRLNC